MFISLFGQTNNFFIFFGLTVCIVIPRCLYTKWFGLVQFVTRLLWTHFCDSLHKMWPDLQPFIFLFDNSKANTTLKNVHNNRNWIFNQLKCSLAPTSSNCRNTIIDILDLAYQSFKQKCFIQIVMRGLSHFDYYIAEQLAKPLLAFTIFVFYTHFLTQILFGFAK